MKRQKNFVEMMIILGSKEWEISKKHVLLNNFHSQ